MLFTGILKNWSGGLPSRFAQDAARGGKAPQRFKFFWENMGKVFHNVYEQVCHPLNIWWAYKAAARGKRYPPAVASFEYDLEKNLIDSKELGDF